MEGRAELVAGIEQRHGAQVEEARMWVAQAPGVARAQAEPADAVDTGREEMYERAAFDVFMSSRSFDGGDVEGLPGVLDDASGAP